MRVGGGRCNCCHKVLHERLKWREQGHSRDKGMTDQILHNIAPKSIKYSLNQFSALPFPSHGRHPPKRLRHFRASLQPGSTAAPSIARDAGISVPIQPTLCSVLNTTTDATRPGLQCPRTPPNKFGIRCKFPVIIIGAPIPDKSRNTSQPSSLRSRLASLHSRQAPHKIA